MTERRWWVEDSGIVLGSSLFLWEGNIPGNANGHQELTTLCLSMPLTFNCTTVLPKLCTAPQGLLRHQSSPWLHWHHCVPPFPQYSHNIFVEIVVCFGWIKGHLNEVKAALKRKPIKIKCLAGSLMTYQGSKVPNLRGNRTGFFLLKLSKHFF